MLEFGSPTAMELNRGPRCGVLEPRTSATVLDTDGSVLEGYLCLYLSISIHARRLDRSHIRGLDEI